MKKLLILPFILFTLAIADEDCIMVKELNVNFNNDSTVYVDNEKEMNKIQEFKDFIEQTDLYVLIEGHTNSKSTAIHNYELSKNRAVKVMQDLQNSGIKKGHVRAMGFGETTPLYENTTTEGLNNNRRVIAEVFNTAEELDSYISEQKNRIEDIKFKEQ